MNIVVAIDLGVEDYVTKPFYSHVFLVKIQDILCRSYECGTNRNLLENQGVV